MADTILVPREPTEAMIRAYCETCERLGIRAWANASVIWPAMLAAAPTPQPLSREEMRKVLAKEIKERGGPQEYLDMLANKFMEIDNELPPELSAALSFGEAIQSHFVRGK